MELDEVIATARTLAAERPYREASDELCRVEHVAFAADGRLTISRELYERLEAVSFEIGDIGTEIDAMPRP